MEPEREPGPDPVAPDGGGNEQEDRHAPVDDGGGGQLVERPAAQSLRERIVALVAARPGLRPAELERELGLTWGGIRYHARAVCELRYTDPSNPRRGLAVYPLDHAQPASRDAGDDPSPGGGASRAGAEPPQPEHDGGTLSPAAELSLHPPASVGAASDPALAQPPDTAEAVGSGTATTPAPPETASSDLSCGAPVESGVTLASLRRRLSVALGAAGETHDDAVLLESVRELRRTVDVQAAEIASLHNRLTAVGVPGADDLTLTERGWYLCGAVLGLRRTA